MQPRKDNPFPFTNFSMSPLASGFKSNLLTQTMAGTLKKAARSATRSMSCFPETVGSVTMSTPLAPPREAITGQPTPGGPSVKIRSRWFFSASFLASCRTKVTSLPEFSSAMPNRAWTMGPNRVCEMLHSPQVFRGKSTAPSGQK